MTSTLLLNASSLIAVAILFGLAAFVYFYDMKKSLNVVFALFSMGFGLWCFGVWKMSTVATPSDAFLWIKVLSAGSLSINVFFLHLNLLLTEKKRIGLLMSIIYSLALIFLLFSSFSNLFTQNVVKTSIGYFAIPGPVYHVYMLFFIFCMGYGLTILIRLVLLTKGIKHTQLMFALIAFLIGTAGGVVSFFPIFRVFILPIWNVTSVVCGIILAVAILKYRLMDISLIVKKTTAYSLVTSAITFTYVLVVIGFEFLSRGLLGYYSFWAAVPAAFIIAVTFVPMRDRLQKITDQVFFRQTVEYQKVIKDITKVMASVTDLHTLFRLIDRTIVRVMRVKNASVLLLEEKEDRYVVEKTNGLPDVVKGIKLQLDDPLVAYLEEKKDAVVLEEVKSLARSDSISLALKEKLEKIQAEMGNFGAAISIPSFLKGRLVGILNLGEKLSGEMYSPDDLELLLTMGQEAAIAIENAKLYRDITETRDYLNSLIQGSADAIITLDLHGRVLTWNKGSEKIFGYKQEEVVGSGMPLFKEPEGRNFIDKIINGQEISAYELTKPTKYGKDIPLLLTMSPIKDPDGQIIGVSAILKDISELKKVEIMKQEFLSVVSHELRTPLTPIKGFLALLLSERPGKLNEEQKKDLNTVLNQSNHLHDLIDSMIDISRIEAGRPLELLQEPLFLDDVVKESLEAAEEAFKAKSIEINAKYPLKPLSLMADRKKLLRLMDNLLGNALKFTPVNGRVDVLVEDIPEGNKVAITDSGIGIAAGNLEKVFDRFYQVDSSYTRACGGIGMGLTIAKEIIEAHGGKIWAESKGLGKGTSIVFLMPVV